MYAVYLYITETEADNKTYSLAPHEKKKFLAFEGRQSFFIIIASYLIGTIAKSLSLVCNLQMMADWKR